MKFGKRLIFGSRRNRFRRLALLLSLIVLIYWLTRPKENIFYRPDNFQFVDKEYLLERVERLQAALTNYKTSQGIHRQINEIISLLRGRNTTQTLDSDPVGESVLEVCPDEWLGTNSGFPFYFQGWKQVNCSNVLPFDKVLTIVLYTSMEDNGNCPRTAQKVIAGLNNLYPNLSVIVSGVPKHCIPTSDTPNVRVADFWGSYVSTPGVTWNYLTKLVTTPYVLVGRDLDDFIWTANLERAVRMLSYNRYLSVAGGAIRNQTGHWRVGCFQVSMKNYVLEYLEGYYASRNECMFCDHLAGPFVTRTKLVQSIKFDETLPAQVLFEDWFWRLQQRSHVVVNCPDIMYLASDPAAVSKTEDRLLWTPLIQKWELNRLVLPSGHVFSYSCAESGISCKGAAYDTDSFLMPICCIEQYASAFKIFHDFCLENKIRYTLDTGSVLGAVKTNGILPWDLDADYVFYTANLSFFENNYAYFQHNGLILRRFSKTGEHSSYFCFDTPDLNVEMWGLPSLEYDDATFGEPFRLTPTKVLHHGYWVYAPHSPATYSRNRYGRETLKHAQHWRHLNMVDSWQTYNPSQFKTCAKPGHHACLDQFRADGNLQFRVPN